MSQQFPPNNQPGAPLPPYAPGYPGQAPLPYQGSYTPPPMPPPSKRTQIARWMRRHPIWTAIIVILCLSVLIGPFTGHSNTTASVGATVAPPHSPATVAPTTPATPTPTPKPQPTQTPTQRIENQTTQLAKDTSPFGTDLSSRYDSDAKTVVITETIGETFSNGTAVTEIKNDCFNIQQAIWKAALPLTSVEIHMQSMLQDQYGKQSMGLMGSCTLNSGTAAQFSWDNLDYNTAWGDYDLTYLLPSLTQ